MKILYLLPLSLVLSGCIIVSNQRTATPVEQPRINYEDPVLNNRQIMLVGSIDKRMAEDTIQKLLYLEKKSSEPIDLYLLTPGGELQSSFAIEQVIKSLACKVNTHALAECNSGGAVLLAAGTGERIAYSDAPIIVHGMVVTGKVPPKMRTVLQDYYTAFWKRRAHLPEDWLPLPPGKIICLTAQDALKYGLVDKVIEK